MKDLPELPEIHNCSTKEEMVAETDRVRDGLLTYLESLPPEDLFMRAVPEGWSIYKNFLHSAKTNRFMAKYLGAPSMVLKLKGKPAKKADITKISPTNRKVSNYGHYEPGRKKGTAHDVSVLKRQLTRSFENLKKSLSKRTEQELDECQGLFGGFDLRGFYLFTLKHAVHHIRVVDQRLRARE